MQQFRDYLTREGVAIRQAPLLFCTALVGAILVLLVIFNWGYGRILENKDSEIRTLTTERDAYKAKSGGATPDEIKAKLDELAEMTRFTIGASWDPLSEAEIEKLAASFKDIPKRWIQVMYSNYRGKELARGFSMALKKAGWTDADLNLTEGAALGVGISTGYNSEIATALKRGIEAHTKYKVQNPPASSVVGEVYYISVGIRIP